MLNSRPVPRLFRLTGLGASSQDYQENVNTEFECPRKAPADNQEDQGENKEGQEVKSGDDHASATFYRPEVHHQEICENFYRFAKSGDVVIDPFCGTQTADYAALRGGYILINCDKDDSGKMRADAAVRTEQVYAFLDRRYLLCEPGAEPVTPTTYVLHSQHIVLFFHKFPVLDGSEMGPIGVRWNGNA